MFRFFRLYRLWISLSLLLMMSLSGFVTAQDTPAAEQTPEVTETPEPPRAGPMVVIPPNGRVRLGFAAVLRGETLSAFGIDVRRAMEMALEDRPTVTIGEVSFPIEFDAEDSECTSDGGQKIANYFVSDERIVAVVGPLCSSACAAAQPIFDEVLMSYVSASCTAPILTAGTSMTFNRTVTSDAQQMVATAQFIQDNLGISSIAIVDDGSTYGVGLANTLDAAFTAIGGEVVTRHNITVGEDDFRVVLQTIADSEPELIYFGGYFVEAGYLARQRFEVGMGGVLFMGGDGILGSELIEYAEESAEGVYASAAAPISSPEVDAFFRRYEATYGERPLSPYTTTAYDATMLILNAIEEVGYIDNDGNLVIERLDLARTLRSAQLDGLTGSLICNGTGECASSPIAMYQVQDENFVLLDTIVPDASIPINRATTRLDVGIQSDSGEDN